MTLTPGTEALFDGEGISSPSHAGVGHVLSPVANAETSSATIFAVNPGLAGTRSSAHPPQTVWTSQKAGRAEGGVPANQAGSSGASAANSARSAASATPTVPEKAAKRACSNPFSTLCPAGRLMCFAARRVDLEQGYFGLLSS